ncbi:Yqey-like protein-domain-containing protein [Tricharina praecox]|uniref:Yqey-like protein-domain-containing protein n=1 Tax=Tricharina praecox TaxID=43433 RepID=UPI00221E6C01|nr:Yqey-like protein-domain-containing protein [Tricharina praecox]KAI5858619.1 Yqey-like protein-domain-containing protein [Tricharina praecox]
MLALRRALPRLALSVRANSTAATAPPPLLTTLRTDLKTAMRAKNQIQLSVLRSLLADITNAQKTATPPNDDLAILQIINKTRQKSAVSIDEARSVGREDLVEKEQAQLSVLDEYAKLVDTVDKEEVVSVVETVLAKLKSEGAKTAMGDVIKAVAKELEGRPVVRSLVAEAVKEALAKK